jgi:hypothetical protein
MKMPNSALNPVRFALWTLRDRAANNWGQSKVKSAFFGSKITGVRVKLNPISLALREKAYEVRSYI